MFEPLFVFRLLQSYSYQGDRRSCSPCAVGCNGVENFRANGRENHFCVIRKSEEALEKKNRARVLILNSLTNRLFAQWRRPCRLLETPRNVSIM